MELNISNKGEIIIAQLVGRLDTVAANDFVTQMQPLLDNADKKIVLDCAQLSFISSSGLRHFLSLRKATVAKHGKVVIKNTTSDVKHVFELTGLVNLFEFE